MSSLTSLVGTLALLGSALVGGVFFAFSSFVMRALARLPASQGITVMQSINVVVINPSFLGAFLGTVLLSLGVAVLALVSRSHPSTGFFLGGAIFYCVGTFLVTMFGNVPLNDRLAAVSATDPGAAGFWMTLSEAMDDVEPHSDGGRNGWQYCCTPWVSCRTAPCDVEIGGCREAWRPHPRLGNHNPLTKDRCWPTPALNQRRGERPPPASPARQGRVGPHSASVLLQRWGRQRLDHAGCGPGAPALIGAEIMVLPLSFKE